MKWTTSSGTVVCACPAPSIELRFVAGGLKIDFLLGAGEAHREPFLALSAIFSLERYADGLGRQVVMNPVLRFGENLHAADAGLLVKLAVCGGLRVSSASIPPWGICQR